MRKKKRGQLGLAPCESYPTSMRAICRVVEEKQHRKIARSPVDRVNMDLFTASAIMSVYDALNPSNQEKFAALPMRKMATVAFKLLK
jgi:hypothetical protein